MTSSNVSRGQLVAGSDPFVFVSYSEQDVLVNVLCNVFPLIAKMCITFQNVQIWYSHLLTIHIV